MKYFLKKPIEKKCSSEIRPLLETINALPAIEIHSYTELNDHCVVFLYIDHKEEKDESGIQKTPLSQGLFFLARSLDFRYLNYFVEIKISVMDIYEEKENLPTIYELHITSDDHATVSEKKRAIIESMNYHLHNENFIKFYNIDLSRFSIWTIRDDRREKIHQII